MRRFRWTRGSAIEGNALGIITANTLSANASGAITLSAHNLITNLGTFSHSGELALTDAGIPTITAPIQGSVALNVVGAGSNIVVDTTWTVGAGFTLDLISSGSITINDPITIDGTGLGLGRGRRDQRQRTRNMFQRVRLRPANRLRYDLRSGNIHCDALLRTGVSMTFGDATDNTLEINGAPYLLIDSLSEVQVLLFPKQLPLGQLCIGEFDRRDLDHELGAYRGTNGSGTLITPNGFSGTFEGLGNTISNLTVSTGASNYAGLFGIRAARYAISF